MISLELLCHDVVELCREVGIFIKMEEHKVYQEDIETKSKNSLVSYVDKTAEEILVKDLALFLPEAGFIAEEGTSDKVGDTYNWIIDPLDGTTNFLHGVPTYSVSVALKRNDTIVIGVVYEVNRDECFYAWEGSEAFLNGAKIEVSSTSKLEDSLLATGFPYYDYQHLNNYFELLKELAKNTRGVRRIGSAAVDLVYMACGRFDAFFEYSLHAWDVAAGGFIAQQAGATVTDFQGDDNWLFGKEIVAVNPQLKSEFATLIKKYLS
jgi:myo-inositol-1(or 4)-monophosphatase|tara:strand:- start:594 stop:1388 length:795 start_codon:yes stop_codon:yes gene_type:complete